MWLADGFNAAYYDLRGRYGPMACRADPSAEYCTEHTEIQPAGSFAVQKLSLEALLTAGAAGGRWGPNGGFENYSDCGLSGGEYSCSCGLGCDCGCDCGSPAGECGCDCDGGLANTIGRCPSHGFATEGTSSPFGDWHSLFAQKGAGIAHWYDFLRAGGCAGPAGAGCTWRVAAHVKATNLAYHQRSVDTLVQARPPTKPASRSARRRYPCGEATAGRDAT